MRKGSGRSMCAGLPCREARDWTDTTGMPGEGGEQDRGAAQGPVASKRRERHRSARAGAHAIIVSDAGRCTPPSIPGSPPGGHRYAGATCRGLPGLGGRRLAPETGRHLGVSRGVPGRWNTPCVRGDRGHRLARIHRPPAAGMAEWWHRPPRRGGDRSGCGAPLLARCDRADADGVAPASQRCQCRVSRRRHLLDSPSSSSVAVASQPLAFRCPTDPSGAPF